MLYHSINTTLMTAPKYINLVPKLKYNVKYNMHRLPRSKPALYDRTRLEYHNTLSLYSRYNESTSIRDYHEYYEKQNYTLTDDYESQPRTGGNRKMLQEIQRITGINSISDFINLVTNNKMYYNIENYVESMAISKLKSTFGKEYYITNAKNITNEYNASLFKFLSKFDPKLDKHYNSVTGEIVPFMGLYKMDKATNMFISTYQFIPGNRDNSMPNEDKIHADIYIYIFGRKSRKYCKILDKCLDLRLTSNINDLIYSVNSIGANGGTDISCIKLSKRKMSSLIYSNDEYKRVMEHVSQFIKGKSFYAEKELSYKTGILLYGSPGTGKSTMAKVLATEFHRAIVSIDMANINHIDFAKLSMMISNEKDEKYIVLLEDIDTMYNLNRANKDEGVKKEDNEAINKLLQFLDSTQSPSDVIFVATTNYVEKLDAALIRDGRFDLKVEVKELDRKDVKKFVETFDMDPAITEDIIKDYCDGKPEPKTFNQAKLQNVILRRIKYDKIIAQSSEDKAIEDKIEQYQEEAQKIASASIDEVKEETE